MSVLSQTSNDTDPIAWLKQDHALIKGRLAELTSTSNASRLSTLNALKKLLSLHNAIEENLVYPSIAKVVARQDQALELYHQTAEADILVFTLTQALQQNDDATFVRTARELTAAVTEHIEIEETRAFPLLEAAPRADVRTLAEQIVEFKKAMVAPQFAP